MENQADNEKKVQELKERMNDARFELDIDALEGAASSSRQLRDLRPSQAQMLFGVIIPSGSALLILPFIFLFLGMICSQAIFKLTSALLSARISTQLKGSYDELVARGGAFAELVKRQRIEGED